MSGGTGDLFGFYLNPTGISSPVAKDREMIRARIRQLQPVYPLQPDSTRGRGGPSKAIPFSGH
jgi:hypothetical protein